MEEGKPEKNPHVLCTQSLACLLSHSFNHSLSHLHARCLLNLLPQKAAFTCPLCGSVVNSLAYLYTFKPQYQDAFSHYCNSYISFGTSWENFFQNPDTSSLVIILYSHNLYVVTRWIVMNENLDPGHCWGLRKSVCTYTLHFRCASSNVYNTNIILCLHNCNTNNIIQKITLQMYSYLYLK